MQEPGSSPSPPLAHGLAVAILAALAVLPGLLPGAEAFLDVPCHRLALDGLAREIFTAGRWTTGWTEQADLGLAVGQLNAPVVWAALAVLVRLGLPALPLLMGAMVASNVVFSLGVLRLGRALLRDPRAALLGAALAATAVPDLYGLGGAVGGMFPYRLANGVLAFGLASPGWLSRPSRLAPWLALVMVLHTYSGVAAAIWLGAAVIVALRERSALVPRLLLGGALGLGLAAFFLVPALDPAIRTVPPPVPFSPLEQLGLLFFGLDPLAVRLEARAAFEGGAAGALWMGLLWAGLGGAGLLAARGALSGALASPDRVKRMVLLLGVGAVVLALAPSLGLTALGPNPWRYGAVLRVPLCLLAAPALLWLGRAGLVLAPALALGAALASAVERVPFRLGEEQVRVWTALEQTWAALDRAAPPGRIYHDDPTFDPDAPELFRFSHVGALMPLSTGRAVVGSWYGVSPSLVTVRASSEGPLILGRPMERLLATPGHARLHLARMGVTGVISASPAFEAALQEEGRFVLVARFPPFAAWTLADAPLAAVMPSSGEAKVSDDQNGRVVADLQVAPGTAFLVQRAWHAWWWATVEGREVALRAEPVTGMLMGVAPGSGRLELRWEDRGELGRVISAVSAAIWLLLLVGERRSAPSISAAGVGAPPG